MTEKIIENNILSFLEECGLFVWKNQTTGVFDPTKKVFRKSHNRFHINGVSDILGILPGGRFLAIEVKSKIGRPTEHQMKYITQINTNGGVSFISRSVEQTYDQLVKFYPSLENNRHLLRKYQILDS